MNKGELEYATRIALNNFDIWNDVTGVITKGESYYYEMQGVIEDAVKIGSKVACEGIKTNLDDILNK
jgi:hypothetical protein